VSVCACMRARAHAYVRACVSERESGAGALLLGPAIWSLKKLCIATQSKEETCVEANQDLIPQYFSCGSWQTYFRTGSPQPSSTTTSSASPYTSTTPTSPTPTSTSPTPRQLSNLFDLAPPTDVSQEPDLVNALSADLPSGG
jgi:hypothetical protein